MIRIFLLVVFDPFWPIGKEPYSSSWTIKNSSAYSKATQMTRKLPLIFVAAQKATYACIKVYLAGVA